MENKILNKDFFLYDKANDSIVCDSQGLPIFYGDYDEAKEDCYGNEYIVQLNELPTHQIEFILSHIKL